MENLDFLLSDEFIEFSQTIADIHSRKKTRQQEMKVVYEKFMADIKALDVEAKTAQTEFEAWKKSKKSDEVPEGE